MDVDVDADNGGWGRPRPKFEDLVPDSDPEPDPEPPVDGVQGGSDDSTEDMTSEDTEHGNDNMQIDEGGEAPAGRVARLIDYPLAGFDGAPCGELNQLYVNEGHQAPQKKFYTVWDNGGEPHNREFTAIFTCPITGEHFASGNLANDKGVTSKDGVHWYKKKQYAKIAAAANYLDCASKEEAGNEARPDSLTKRALLQWYLSFTRKLDTIGIELEMPINESGPHADSYDCLSMGDDHNKRFTAIFTCNFTGERFASGKLIGKEGEYKTCDWYYNEGEQILFNTVSSDFEERLGLKKVTLVWYRTKKDAEDAAAGRAIDCLRFRDGSDNSGSTRKYCSEAPYNVGDSPVPQEVRGAVVGHNELFGESIIELWHTVPYDDRMTVRFGVPGLHSFLEAPLDWRERYMQRRGQVEDIVSSGN